LHYVLLPAALLSKFRVPLTVVLVSLEQTMKAIAVALHEMGKKFGKNNVNDMFMLDGKNELAIL